MDKKIDDKIKKLENELVALKAERDGKRGILPEQTKSLIEKYYGHCFLFEGYESGTFKMILRSIKVDRQKKEVWLCGNFIIYITPDITFLPNINGRPSTFIPMGGKMSCEGEINISWIPYVNFMWDDFMDDIPIYKQIDEILKENEMPYDDFEKAMEKVDDNDLAHLCPLDKVIEEYNNTGWDWEYKQIFGNL